MTQYALFPSFSDLVDLVCSWSDGEHGAFPRAIYCGEGRGKPCAAQFADFTGQSAEVQEILRRLASQCGFQIQVESALPAGLRAVPLEELPGWSHVLRDPFTLSPAGAGKDGRGSGGSAGVARRYILGSKTAENSESIWRALRACRAPGLAARVVPEAAVVGNCPYRYFWLVTSGLPVETLDGHPEIPLPPPLTILQLADRAWWQLPVEAEEKTQFYFEWPFEPTLGPGALRALAETEGDAILLSRHEPRHVRLARFEDEQVFREVIDVFDIMRPTETFTAPRLEPESREATFDIDLRLVKQMGKRAAAERDRNLEVAINSLVLRRSRRKALDLRMGRVGQAVVGPFAFDSIDDLPPGLKDAFRQWIESDERQRQRYLIREIFVEPLLVFVAPPDEIPQPIAELLIDFAGQDEDLHALRHICLTTPPFAEWGLGREMPAHVHLLTTELAVSPIADDSARAHRLRTLGLRLLDYGRRAHRRFDLNVDWKTHQLRLFLPHDRQLEFYPHIEPSPLAAKKIATALLPRTVDGGDPREEWCSLVLPGVRGDDPVRCVHLRRADFQPLSAAFAWDCRSTATSIQPDFPAGLTAAADTLAGTVDEVFQRRARTAVEGVVAVRVGEVDATRAALEAEMERARQIGRQAQQTNDEGARLHEEATKIERTREELHNALTILSVGIDRTCQSAGQTHTAVQTLSQLDTALTSLKQSITRILAGLKTPPSS